MLVFTHPACLQHDPGRGHPECPERLQVVLDALRASYPDQLDWRQAPPAKFGELARVHDSALIDLVLAPQTEPLRLIDMDTMTSPGSASAALHAAGAGVAAVDAVMLGGDPVAFCAVRPPGHHATATTAMGFCLFNNIAIAAAYARDRYGLERIAVVDFDVHHGNGTQDIFVADPRVAYYSTHQAGLFPNSGLRRDRGAGNLLNILLPPAAAAGLGRFRCPPARPAGRPDAGNRGFRLDHRRAPPAGPSPWRRPHGLHAGGRIRPAGACRMLRRARRRAAVR
jgi:acetoin utilization deacetylase AcuC-like enzyme